MFIKVLISVSKLEYGRVSNSVELEGILLLLEGEYAKQPDGTSERSGSGKHCTTDGITYDGQWAGDCMNGKGKMLFPSGAVYEGDFVNNRFHGQGKYQWPNGSFYIGQFFENK